MWPNRAFVSFVMASMLLRNAAGWLASPVSTRIAARGFSKCTVWQTTRSIGSTLRLSAELEGQAGPTSVEKIHDDDDSDDDEDGPGSSGRRKSKLRAIRQHVNPLTKGYQMPVELPDGWIEKAYARPLQPFHVDIGSARGQFCVNMARAFPEVNFLGLEIRKPCVEESMKKVQKYGVDNLHYLAVNANVDYERIAKYLNEKSKIIRATIQYPDPHFKTKHAKRRMVQVELARAVSASLAPEGEILLQSDLEWVAQNMRECFADDPLIEDVMPPGEWMAENPLGIPTEREKLTLSRGDPVFRTVYRRRPGVAPPA